MNEDQLRDLVQANPFREFVIETNSGKKIEIVSRDHLFFVPNQPVIIAVDVQGRLSIVSLSNIALITVGKTIK